MLAMWPHDQLSDHLARIQQHVWHWLQLPKPSLAPESYPIAAFDMQGWLCDLQSSQKNCQGASTRVYALTKDRLQ